MLKILIMARVDYHSDDHEDMQRAVYEPLNNLNSHFSEVRETRNASKHLPFCLDIPLDTEDSSPRGVFQWSVSLEEQQHGDQETELPDIQCLDDPIDSEANATVEHRIRRLKPLKKSRHGILYSSLPPKVSKRIASSFDCKSGGRQTGMSRETLGAITEAGDSFFQQLGGDLSAFAKHAGRKKIRESDVITVMER